MSTTLRPASPKKTEVRLGFASDFTSFPTPITIGESIYFLIREDQGYKLLSSVCPHLGAEVALKSGCLECPSHGWRFDLLTGRGTNNTKRLTSIPVQVREDVLFAQIVTLEALKNVPSKEKRELDFSIKLHAHACLEVASEGFSLLTDPWLVGPAFLGAWTQYPPPSIHPKNLRPNAIWISHEHSDHFHEPTLHHFDKATPIYFPDFPNRRLPQRLKELGFVDARPMQFGQKCQVSPTISITCFEPSSSWNDCIVLIEIGNFRLLNLNDAGLNQRIAALVAPVDAVASSFSPGASSYPLTWAHLDDQQKSKIMEKSRQGLLGMLQQAMDLYKAPRLIPFASHFSLWHPSHQKYLPAFKKNTVLDVCDFFAGSATQVIDLLPGETWQAASDRIERVWTDRKALYQLDRIRDYATQRCRDESDERTETNPLSRTEVAEHFLRLNQVPETVFCEDLTVDVRVMDSELKTLHWEVPFQISSGRLTLLDDAPVTPNLSIEIPRPILAQIIRQDISWDEAHIGYWCRFARNPDVYHAGFWRLLQAPYYKKPAELPAASRQALTEDTVIAELIEAHGDEADRILRRYGLYCAGCHHSTSDSIRLGAKHHGLSEDTLHKIVLELNQVFPGPKPPKLAAA